MGVEELAHRIVDLGALDEYFFNAVVDNEVNIAAAVAGSSNAS
jgi:hypothetical protein